jgi:predicted porin
MNRTLIAVAVAGAVGLPAFAVAQSTVQIYGNINTEYVKTSRGNGVQGTDTLQNTGGSRLGFRGTERVGSGMNAWFQIETNVISDAPSAAYSTSNGVNNGRNTAVGLQGGFGNFVLGHWDTPMKWSNISGYSWQDTGLGSGHTLIGGGAPGTSAANTNRQSFYRREQNTIQYWSPNMSGFEGRVAVSAAEAKTVDGAPVGSTPRVWSFAGKYSNGPILASLAYEKHDDAVAGGVGVGALNRNVSDNSWLFGVGYKFGSFSLSGLYERMKWEGQSGADAERKTYGLFGNWAISGPHTARIMYTKAKSTTGSGTNATMGGGFAAGNATMQFNGGAGNTGASHWALQYEYALSKRTQATLTYAKLNNDSAATYGLFGDGAGAATAGQSQHGYGFGVKHAF